MLILKYPTHEAFRHLKRTVFLVCLIPLAWLLTAGLSGALGADPVPVLSHFTGLWSLNFLFIALALTPLRWYTAWHWPLRLRRTVALFALLYALLHVLIYLLCEHYFDGRAILRDLGRRPHIVAGFLGFLLFVPLAAMSTERVLRRLGQRHWKALHRLAYCAAGAAVFHYLWLVKWDVTSPGAYALVLCLLLCIRLAQGRSRAGVDAPAPERSRSQPVSDQQMFTVRSVR